MKLKRSRIGETLLNWGFVALAIAGLAISFARAHAQSEDTQAESFDGNREPAAAKKKKAAKKSSGSSSASSSRSGGSGADSTEGYIIQKTDKGLVKVPRKQVFKFDGSKVEGQAMRPTQSALGSRPGARSESLIPERNSFRKEVLDTVAFPSRSAR